jgi:hypothetical protein
MKLVSQIKAMVLKSILFLVLSGATIRAMPQSGSVGVYLTVKNKRNCEHRLPSSDEKKYCVAAQPVITMGDFAYITEIEKDFSNKPYFSIAFTDQGVTKLRNLATALPNNPLALVVDNMIIGFIKNLDVLRNNKLKISGDEQITLTLETIHEKFRKVLTVKKS